MKKKIYIIITILSLLLCTIFIIHRNTISKGKITIKLEEKTMDLTAINPEYHIFASRKSSITFKTLYGYIKEIITFITSIMGFILTIREIKRKKYER